MTTTSDDPDTIPSKRTLPSDTDPLKRLKPSTEETTAEAPNANQGVDMNFQSLLRIFYQRIFPFTEMYQWLSYGDLQKNNFSNREWSFTLASDVYIRFQSFRNVEEFKAEVLRLCPVKIDIGAVYNIQPRDKKTIQPGAFKPLERELVFDIDMTDYDEIRTCCSGGDVCRVCWDFMTVAIKVVHKTLTDDFGFKNLLWVYSGRRGVHCWVCDERARKMPSEGRRAIVSFLEVIKGGENAGRKTNLPKSLHPSLRRAYEVLVPHFRKTVVEGMQVLSVRDHWTKLLALVPDEDVRKRLDQQWSTRERSNESRWEDLVSELNSKKKSLYNVERDIIFQYTYPRLDSNVSIGLNHLLKAPFCVHPKTGKVCVPMDPDRCEEFDPMDVPTLESVLNDEGTSKRIGVERFCKVFLRGVGEEVRRGLKERNILEF